MGMDISEIKCSILQIVKKTPRRTRPDFTDVIEKITYQKFKDIINEMVTSDELLSGVVFSKANGINDVPHFHNAIITVRGEQFLADNSKSFKS